MSLTNTQYNALTRAYDRLRSDDRIKHENRLNSIYEKCPALLQTINSLSENAAERAKATILGQTDLIEQLECGKTVLLKKYHELLYSQGLTEQDLQMQYHCPDCMDTGYIDNRKCHCFLNAEIALLYEKSNLNQLLGKENFSSFDVSLFSKEPDKDGVSEFERMEQRVKICRNFIDHFDESSENLLFFGMPGVGKTFLSNCIAKALLDSYHSVVYFSSGTLFERFSQSMRNQDEFDGYAFDEVLVESDLLIIDDLGTEFVNAYTNGKFFSLINERLLREKSTLISTNLNLSELSDRYSERVASRIISSYTHVPFVGEDLRIRLKIQNMKSI